MLLEAMAKAGCNGIQFGVESGAQEILQSIKGIDQDRVLHVVKKTRKLNIRAFCSFMVPLPDDTPDTLRETKRFIAQLKDAGADIGMSYTCPYPGTSLYENAKAFGIRVLPQSWDGFSTRSPMIETEYLNAFQIQEFMEETARELGFRCTASG
jgi:radical SAM superfamily enzyme YgiQ (UPF0313 family)